MPIDRDTAAGRRIGDVLPLTMPTLEDLCGDGPGGYVPTPPRPGAPSLTQRIVRAVLADRKAAAAECEAAAAQWDFGIALEAGDDDTARILAAMAGQYRRAAGERRAEAWIAIAGVRATAADEARRWLYCAAGEAAAVVEPAGDVRDGYARPGDALEPLFGRLADAAGRTYPDVPAGASYLGLPDASVALVAEWRRRRAAASESESEEAAVHPRVGGGAADGSASTGS